MIVLTIEIGVREAFGVYALAAKIRSLGGDCIVLPRHVLARAALYLRNCVVVIDGARDVRGRSRMLQKLKNNDNIVCLYDTEGFALSDNALQIRYPQNNVFMIDYILTWGVSVESRLIDLGHRDKIIRFGNPQISFFFENHKKFTSNIKNKSVLVTTKFPAADIVYSANPINHDRKERIKRNRDIFLNYVQKNFHDFNVRVHPNERVSYYLDKNISVLDHRKSSSFEDLCNHQLVVGSNCTTLIEGAVLGKKPINLLLDDYYEDIVSVSFNFDPDGNLLSNPKRQVSDIIYFSQNGYSNEVQASILVGLDSNNNAGSKVRKFILKYFAELLRAYPKIESFKYNHGYVSKVKNYEF